MAARLWQRVLIGEMALAAVLAWLLAIGLRLSLGLRLSAPATIASALAVFAALQWLLPAAAWLLARMRARSLHELDGSLPERSPSVRAALRSVATEGAALSRALIAMSTAPLHRPLRLNPPSHAPRAKPVLLIHGVLCNGAVWRLLVRRLEQAGFGPVCTLNLEPLGADIECHAARVAQELAVMRRECGGEQIAIIAHSMGGLVARAALRVIGKQAVPAPGAPPAKPTVSHIVTIATPHHGTAAAGLLHSKPMRQMSPRSPWIRTLNAADGPDAATITSVFSLDDEFVVPPSSARLNGAHNVELRGIGHFGLLISRRASDAILHALAGESLENTWSRR